MRKYPLVVCDNCGQTFEWTRNSYHLRISEHHFCNRDCYYEWRKEIKNHPHWKGGTAFRLDYEFTKDKEHPFADVTGYVKTSRLVMEEHLGRYLLPEEVVHHIDGNRNNNDINNLMLFANLSEHQKYHWKIKNQEKEKQLVFI